jgi:hypothetical protein
MGLRFLSSLASRCAHVTGDNEYESEKNYMRDDILVLMIFIL